MWGLYEVGHVKAILHKDTVSRTFMLGTIPDYIWKGALYLLDQGYPASFTGNSLIKGIAYLPAAGPTRAAVDAKDFNRKKLVEGDIQKSNNKLPTLNEAYLKDVLLQARCIALPGDQSARLLKKDSLVVSFDQSTVRIHSSGSPLSLSHIIIKGNIIISSDTMIEISSSAHLQNIILTAPKIIFKVDFKGTVQAFATDTLITGEGSQFSIPQHWHCSKLILWTISLSSFISKKCKLEGVALQYVSFLDRSHATLAISQYAEVIGQVYAGGWTNHEGKISGMLVSNKFFLKRPSGLYENYLLDCTLDRSALSPFFLGSPLFSKSRKNIAKWLE